MSELIHFRTHKKWSHTGTLSSERIRARGSEYEWLRAAHPYDDARDIAWRQSLKTDTIYVKSREDTTDIRIILLGFTDMSWDFSLAENDDKYPAYKRLAHACEKSTRQGHIPYSESPPSSDIRWIITKLVQDKTHNHLILAVISSLDRKDYEPFRKLSKHNDIIIIHLFHPYEMTPALYPTTLIESTLIDTEKYHTLFDEKQKEIQKFLIWNNIGYIKISTTENAVERLNHYFKHLYAR